MTIWIIFAVTFIAVLGIALVAARARSNRRNRMSEVWSETEVDYRARDDRVPNLEETLKMYGFQKREGSEAQAAQATPSPQPVAGPAPTGKQGALEPAPRRDSLAEAS
ncbi:MAG TPA: hypothetical protein VMS00_11510 [Acidimicrobiales bacterium]|nr:hypothetical protein [Acidimicrobiales bacterium]